MSGISPCDTFESEDESSSWIETSETSLDDGLSDELTLLNGDEDCDDDTLSFEALIKLSMRLKKQYNLREATVELERCDKIWETMQLVKNIQMNYESESAPTDDENDEDDDDDVDNPPPTVDSRLPEGAFTSIPYIKYQPVQGVGNSALPNFYLAVKSQKKLYNCVTCGKQYSEKRSLALHSQKEHGVVAPKPVKLRQSRRRRSADNKSSTDRYFPDANANRASSTRDRENSKSRCFGTAKNDAESRTNVKKEPEATSSTKKTGEITFVCPYCKSKHRYQRGLTQHMMSVHEMTLAEVRAKYKNDIANATPPFAETNTKNSESTKNVAPVKDDGSNNFDHVGPEISHNSGKDYYYVFTCKPCGRKFKEKRFLRIHMRNKHRIILSRARAPRRNKNEIVKDFDFYQCEIVKFQTPRNLPAMNANNDERPAKTTRSGRSIGYSPGVDRPRRACAVNTSYRECTKEEEEMLQKALVYGNSGEESGESSGVEKQSQCFLCKKSFVDIRRHLIDYHRINCPETIMPLTPKNDDVEKPESVGSNETVEISTDVQSEETAQQRKSREWEMKCRQVAENPHVLIIRNIKGHKNGRTTFQCLLCSHKFNRIRTLKEHVERHTTNGAMRPHSPPFIGKKSVRQFDEQTFPEDPIVDPLSLTDSADSTTSDGPEKSKNVETSRRIVEKRITRSFDERSDSDSDDRTKRRKIDDTLEFHNVESESTTESVNNYTNEMENPLVTSDTDCGSNEEDKSGNCRDTRDSSDRDSGIGISITIKKRNNSYEVVEKDSCDDEKSKDSENSKDENTSSDSSSNATPVDFVMNDHPDAHGREIVDCGTEIVDCEREVSNLDDDKGIVESVGPNFDGDETFRTKSGVESRSRVDEEENFRWKKADCYETDDCTILSGLVRPETT